MTNASVTAPTSPSQGAFDLARARSLAGLCEAAYLPSRDAIASALNTGAVEVFSAGAVFGCTACVAGEALLVFRGTTPAGEAWNQSLAQWLANLTFGQAEQAGCRVHLGFATALDRVWDQVLRQIAPLAAAGPVWVTGHSLGGALAQLAATRLADTGVPVAAVYSFGTPRVGDSVFAATYRSVLHRVEAANDLVCHVPPTPAVVQALRPVLGRVMPGRLAWAMPADVSYEHAGQLAFIDWDGKVRAGLAPAAQDLLLRERLVRLGLAALTRESLWRFHAVEHYIERLALAAESS